MISPELLNLLNSLPLHVILIAGLIILWRQNNKLTQDIIDLKTGQIIHQETLEAQNKALDVIKAQTNGINRSASK